VAAKTACGSVGLDTHAADGATPLDPDEAEGLIPSHIATQGELNAWEATNIAEAQKWAFASKRDILTEQFVRELHLRMFGETWELAGKYRKSGKSVGITAHNIPVVVRELLRDVSVWLEQESYSLEEIAVRLHHRLVAIHPFVNGNGRHTRMMADLLLWNRNQNPLSWGGAGDMAHKSQMRKAYLAALRSADNGDVRPLIQFAKRGKY
jgi:Fic-DOC domain mobile mystery protein B